MDRTLQTKPVVHYRKSKDDLIKEGASAWVYPIDHPDRANVSNKRLVKTSTVIRVLPSGMGFETRNSLYEAVL